MTALHDLLEKTALEARRVIEDETGEVRIVPRDLREIAVAAWVMNTYRQYQRDLAAGKISTVIKGRTVVPKTIASFFPYNAFEIGGPELGSLPELRALPKIKIRKRIRRISIRGEQWKRRINRWWSEG